MGILQNLTTKKELKELFTEGEIVFKEMNSAIQPVRNVYYHYEYVLLGHINRNQEISLRDINLSLTKYENYIDQLFTIKENCCKVLSTNPKLQSKFFNENETLNNNFNKILDRINCLIKNILKFDDYKQINEFNIILIGLQRIKRNMLNKLNNPHYQFEELLSTQKTAHI